MHESTPSSAADDLLLESELEKLFALQDKALTREKKSILVRELMATGIPLKALLSGVRSLVSEDLGSIKFSTICAVSRRFIEPDPETGKHCEKCLSGYVVMKDGEGRFFSLACNCPAGVGKANTQALTRWSGQDTQSVRGGRVLTRIS